MDLQELVARFMYDLLTDKDHALGLLTNIVSYDDAEYSAMTPVQDTYFKSNKLASQLLDVMQDNGFNIKQKVRQ